ncbi:MerR family transcriptional regulator [Alkalihalobacillus sp. LMS39]|uniref:MerR family transcriptional regulator n=1 Tax=Alkalihalobacillus sp. LMS39 TaxID=2924032 RepID=UPI001FB56A9A|nr:MerR family transcriptional regulator [Alkalihalobacillus sp. LMS39]UOE95825.1 MerR family transcriptional regulator [Alkalihalobacillus sp. LMS39]
MYTVKKFANMTGVTERTLRYYDRKGVLTPSVYSSQGHRLYQEEDLFKMQQIVTLKYVGFSLADIKEFLSEDSERSMQRSLQMQKQLLEQKRAELDHVIQTISKVETMIKEDIHSDLILMIIHSIQHENAQKQWLANHVSDDTVERVFMKHLPEEERTMIENKVLELVKNIQQYYEKDVPPDDKRVQVIIEELFTCLHEVIDPRDLEELETVEFSEDSLFLFSFMSKELQNYIEQAAGFYQNNNDDENGGDSL